MDCLQTMIEDVRDLVDEPSDDAADWTDARIVKHINRQMTHLAMLIAKRHQDFFARDYIIPLVTDTYAYELPRGKIRVIELIKSGVTDAGNGVYTVDEKNMSAYELDGVMFRQDPAGEDYGYFVWGNTLNLSTDISDVKTGYYLRVRMIQSIPRLFAGTMASATATTLVAAAAAPTYGEAARLSNVYNGFGLKIYDGTGAGQERTVMGDSYDGTNHTFTVSTWTTTPAGVVYFSLTPPFPPEFEDPLVMGAALRCKWKVEDANSELRQDYQMALMQALDFITPRDSDNRRRLRRTAGWNRAGKTIIIRRP